MRLIIIFLFFGLSNSMMGQNDIALKYKLTDTSILIRWAVSDFKIFKENVLNGYSLKKLEVLSVESQNNLNWENAEEIIVYPYSERDTFWVNNQKRDQRTILIRSLLYNYEFNNEIEEQNTYGLTLVACDQSKFLSKAAGLFYEDKNIEKGKNYIYRIEPKGKTKIKSEIQINNRDEENLQIQKFELTKRQKSIDISWVHKGLMMEYSSFDIERSEDSISFTSILKQRFVPMNSQFEKDKEISIWNDTSVLLNHKYFYKISAYDYFGEKVMETTVKSIYLTPYLQLQIVIDSIFEKEPKQVSISWSHEVDTNIKEYHIYYSNTFNGKYKLKAKTKLQNVLIPINNYSNYFKVSAVSKFNDSITSWPELYVLPDRTVPQSVSDLQGKIDSLGNVNISWKENTEADLQGYRVFRANNKTEEFLEVTKKFAVENSFYDSIYLENLTEDIFYFVTAVDLNYNNSTISDTLKLKKPDIVAPVSAQIRNLISDSNGILIEWVASSSKDVILSQILSSNDNNNFKVLASFSSDIKNTTFLDSSVSFEKGVYYKMRVEDDAGNSSFSNSIYCESQKRTNLKTNKVEANVNRIEKSIQLKWEGLNSEVFSYTIYKAKLGETLRSYVTLGAGQLSYSDKNLYISNNYTYSIKATLESGKEIMLIENLVVEY